MTASPSGTSLAEPHTLPVAALVPLSLTLTLEDFEAVLAEAIYLGGQGGVSSEAAPAGGEQHPKEEARARTAAAVARMRKAQNWKEPGGFFRSEN